MLCRLSYWVRSKKFCAEYEIKSYAVMAGTAGFAFQRESHGGSNNPPDYSQEPPFESKDSKSAVMAGTAGFEPANVGVKGRCLTAWRRPCIRLDCMEPVLIFITRCIKQRVTWFHMGWVKGLEPSTLGTTIRCSNQLSYTHHIKFAADGNGTPGGIRTPGLLLRRQLLYPAELLAHINSDKPIRRKWSG